MTAVIPLIPSDLAPAPQDGTIRADVAGVRAKGPHAHGLQDHKAGSAAESFESYLNDAAGVANLVLDAAQPTGIVPPCSDCATTAEFLTQLKLPQFTSPQTGVVESNGTSAGSSKNAPDTATATDVLPDLFTAAPNQGSQSQGANSVQQSTATQVLPHPQDAAVADPFRITPPAAAEPFQVEDVGFRQFADADTESRGFNQTRANVETAAIGEFGTSARNDGLEAIQTSNRESVSVRPISEQLAPRLVTWAQVAAHKDRTEFTLRLDPPELGTVRVHLSASDTQLVIRMVASDEVARQIIDSQLHELRRTLAETGIGFSRCDVTCDDGSSQRAPQEQTPEFPFVPTPEPVPQQPDQWWLGSVSHEPGRINVIA